MGGGRRFLSEERKPAESSSHIDWLVLQGEKSIRLGSFLFLKTLRREPGNSDRRERQQVSEHFLRDVGQISQ